MSARQRLILGLMLALSLAPPLLSVNPNLSLGQYLHTTWTQEEGSALPPIRALAQTANGYLWLASGTGLIRFDGMRFQEWSPAVGPALPSPDVRCLRPASAGGLWVGTADGLCRLDRGRVIPYPWKGKFPCGLIAAILEDRSGRLWILNECTRATTLGLLQPNGTWQTFAAKDGLPDQKLRSLFQDREGSLWVGTSNSICQWLPGSPAGCSKSPPSGIASIAEDVNGQLVIVDEDREQVFRFTHGQPQPLGPRFADSSVVRGAMVCDRDGNLWMGTTGQGLLRLQDNKIDRLTRHEGLSSNSVNSLMEDREGDLWVATARGVDRIRDPKVQLFSQLNGLSSDLINSVYSSHDGAIWIGTTGGLNRLAGEAVTRYSKAEGLPSPTVLSLYEESPGRLWVGTGTGLAVQSGGRFMEVLTASGQHLERVFNIGGNHSGTVWLADTKLGLFAVRAGVAQPVAVPDLGSGDIFGLMVARNGDVWLGHFRGGITVLSNGAAKHYDTHDGVSEGAVRAVYEDREGTVWVGTSGGLSRFRDSTWTNWSAAQNLPEGGVQSIVEDQPGELWLWTAAGVLRLSRSSLEGPAKALPYVLYGRTEGLRLTNSSASPRLTRSNDGRVWVCTEDGVAAIDPSRVKKNLVAPPVVIEQVIIDGKPFDANSPEEATFRGHNLEIAYTGVSLMVPERVHFRFRLYGLENTWKDVGTRRNVTYTNLAPGHYRFKVIASNNDGLWNEAGADVRLNVIPYFYQTTWFALVCVTSTLLFVWFIHRMNMRRVVSRIQLIAAERVRFSRELHDSLLQGFSGVVYLLEAAARQFETSPAASKQRLERALDQADQSLREARQMIVSMRIPALENNTLPEALRATVAQMVSELPLDYQFELNGKVRQGPYDVEANLFLIAREAVTNALNHAAATRIRLELSYTPKQLQLTVQDNGKGFDPELAMAKAGHWGFRGMRERARVIGATFAVETAPGRGTTITVVYLWKK